MLCFTLNSLTINSFIYLYFQHTAYTVKYFDIKYHYRLSSHVNYSASVMWLTTFTYGGKLTQLIPFWFEYTCCTRSRNGADIFSPSLMCWGSSHCFRHLCASLDPHSFPQSRYWHLEHQQMLQIRDLSSFSGEHLPYIPLIIFLYVLVTSYWYPYTLLL